MNRKKFKNEVIEDKKNDRGKLLKQKGRAVGTASVEEVRRFFMLSLDLQCIAGFDGYFKCLNPAWTTRLGWTLEELEARPFLDFVHPDDHTATTAELGRLREGKETILFENRYRHKDGSYRWLQWNARSDEGLEQVYATARDVTRQRQLEKEIIEIIDLERERLSRELHDGLCQTLAGIGALSSTLSKKLSANSQFAEAAASAEITKLLSECIGDARNVAHGLSPLNIDTYSLDEALETLALNFQRVHRVSCTFACDRPFPGIGRATGQHLFRITQQALNNAVAHGKGSHLEICLSFKNQAGILTIRDDGVGISDNSILNKGLGLNSMSYRARIIGGSLTLRGRPGRGTLVICSFPLSDPATSGENQNRGLKEILKEIPE